MDKFAILGGGPSAFYVASRLLSRVPKESRRKLVVHMYDRLWAPHGLVRYGVAPDHPEVKNCTHKFDEIAMDARFCYFGNVQVGRTSGHPIPHAVQLSLQDIQQNYTHLVLASGCPVPAIHPALPPSSHVIPALDMVHWYTQHPTQALTPPLESTQHVTVIGQGNVALDVARMLLTSPDVLGAYDVPSPVLCALRASTVRHVSIVGRRGPLQAAFTTKELRELMNIPDASMVPLDPALLQPPKGIKPSRQQSRTLDLLRKGSVSAAGSTRKTWSLDFFRAPLSVKEASGSGNNLAVELARTILDTDARAIPTGETDTVGTDLVVAALGQELDPSTPFYDPVTRRIPVDATGNVLTPAGTTYANVFASGWAAMGAHGVLASTMMNAYNVADNIAARLCGELGGIEGAERVMREDIAADDDAPPQMVREEAQVGNVVSYEDWKIIDAEEVRRGEEMGKERERMVWKEAKELLSATRA